MLPGKAVRFVCIDELLVITACLSMTLSGLGTDGEVQIKIAFLFAKLHALIYRYYIREKAMLNGQYSRIYWFFP
jgi:hypothetical protein